MVVIRPIASAAMVRFLGIAGACLILGASGVVAQSDEPRPLVADRTDSGAAYKGSLGWSGVRSEVLYFDPEFPAPELTTRARVRDADPVLDPTPNEAITISRVLTFVILAVILYLIIRFGNFSVVSLKREDKSQSSRVRDREDIRSEIPQEIPALARIREMADRALALNLLLAGALNIAAEAQGMRIHPSWTVRDALRRIPRSWKFRPALADLASEAERVHFGGRPITEDAFLRHYEAMVPVYKGEAT